MSEHTRWPVWVGAIWLLGLVVLFKPWIHGTDPVGYYSWLRSAVVDGDVDTTDEFQAYGGVEVSPGPTGRNRNPYPVGSALLWAPAYVVAHAASLALGLGDDGYGRLEIVAASLASALYGLLALLLCHRAAVDFFSRRSASLATAGVWWGSPLAFYMFCHPLMSHANDAFACALFFFIWLRMRTSPSAAGWAALGAAYGLATLVRLQNVLLVLLPLVEVVWQRRRWAAAPRRAVVAALAFGAAAAVVLAPQIAVWRLTFGLFLPRNPYGSGQTQMTFVPSHALDVLLSTRHGLVPWAPILAVAVAGVIGPLRRRDPGLALGALAVFVAQLYLVSSWATWWGGAAFGPRLFLGCTPIFVLGLGALLDDLDRRVGRRTVVVGLAVLIAWEMLLLIQYVTNMVPHAAPMSPTQLVLGQLRAPAVLFTRFRALLDARFGIWR